MVLHSVYTSRDVTVTAVSSTAELGKGGMGKQVGGYPRIYQTLIKHVLFRVNFFLVVSSFLLGVFKLLLLLLFLLFTA